MKKRNKTKKRTTKTEIMIKQPFLFSMATLLMAIFTYSMGFSQQKFPSIETTSLTDQTVQFPEEVNNKPTLVALIFSNKAQDDLNSWLEPIYQQVLDKNGMGQLVYDCNMKLIVAFTGARKAAANKVEKELKKASDKEYLKHVLLYEGDFSLFKEPLQNPSKKEVYFFVIDENGKIQEIESGRYSQRKFDKLSTFIER